MNTTTKTEPTGMRIARLYIRRCLVQGQKPRLDMIAKTTVLETGGAELLIEDEKRRFGAEIDEIAAKGH